MSGGEGEHHESHFLHNLLTGVGIADSTLGVAEGVLNSPLGHAGHEFLHHHAPNLMPGLGAFVGPLGFLAGGAEVGMGGAELAHGDLGGAVTMGKGVASMVGGGVSTLGALSGAAGGASVLGVSSGAATATSATLGTMGSLFTTGTGAVAAAPVAGVAGALGAGLAAGTGMAAASDSKYTRTGLWGYDQDTGRANSAMDRAANWGLDYDRENGVKPGDWSWGGAARSMIGGVGAGIAGSAQALYNWSGAGAAVDGVGRALSNAPHEIGTAYGGVPGL